MKQIKFGQLFTLQNKVFQLRKCKDEVEMLNPCKFCNAKTRKRIWVGNHFENKECCMMDLPECDLCGYFKRIK